MGSSESKEHIPRLIRFLDEINYRHTPPPPPCPEFLSTHHHWMHHVLGPRTSWTTAMLTRLEDLSSTFCSRPYPFADVEMQSILARLTAIVLFLDDSIMDSNACGDVEDFSRRVYMGEAQKTDTVLSLYHECIKELCEVYEGDAVLRGLAVTSWLTFPDGCLLEKRLLTVDEEVRASIYDMGYPRLRERRSAAGKGGGVGPEGTSHEAEVKFPLFLRSRNGLGEANAAAVFKASRSQQLPLSRFVKAFPDMIYVPFRANGQEVGNDLLSFYKERLAGETVNMISLQHKSWSKLSSRDGTSGTGPTGEWTLQDTFSRLCNEMRDAILRVDDLLRMEACEKIERGEVNCADVGLDVEDVTIVRQWREFRHGYISWHLENPRYMLNFMDLGRYE